MSEPERIAQIRERLEMVTRQFHGGALTVWNPDCLASWDDVRFLLETAAVQAATIAQLQSSVTILESINGIRELGEMMDRAGIIAPCPACVSENGAVDPECQHCHGTGRSQ